MTIITDTIPWIITTLKIIAPLIAVYFIIRVAATFIKGYTNFIGAINTITASKARLFFVAIIVGLAVWGIFKIFERIGW